MQLPVNKCRAKRKNSNNWVTGFYAFKEIINKHYILVENHIAYSVDSSFDEIEIDSETIELIIDN